MTLSKDDGNKKALFRGIERLGERYIADNLSEYNDNKLENDWWEALQFFFGHSFMRGRRDELSTQYYDFTIKALEEYLAIKEDSTDSSCRKLQSWKDYCSIKPVVDFKKDNKLTRKNSLSKEYREDFNRRVISKNGLIEALTSPRKILTSNKKEKTIELQNDKDLLMVLNTLEFITAKEHKNIYSYIKRKIITSGLEDAYNDLDELKEVGDKIAAFIIRDILLMNPSLLPKNRITDVEFECAFPIDTWVEKVAEKLCFQSSNKSEDNCEKIKQFFLVNCKQYKCDELKVAAGLWYLGYNSLDLLIENLRKS